MCGIAPWEKLSCCCSGEGLTHGVGGRPGLLQLVPRLGSRNVHRDGNVGPAQPPWPAYRLCSVHSRWTGCDRRDWLMSSSPGLECPSQGLRDWPPHRAGSNSHESHLLGGISLTRSFAPCSWVLPPVSVYSPCVFPTGSGF